MRPASETPWTDLLRLSDRELDLVIVELDRLGGEGKGAELRQDARSMCRAWRRIIVEIQQGSAKTSVMRYRVKPNDLSKGGMSFLHGAFVYPGTRCTAMLPTVDRGALRVPGQIVRCRFITGRIHEIGMHFAEPLDPALCLGETAGDGVQPGEGERAA